jgi:hypothetical protein
MAITEDCERQMPCGVPPACCGPELGHPSMASSRTESNESPTQFMNSLRLRNEELLRGRPQSSIAVDVDGYILFTSTLALSKSLWGTVLRPLSSSRIILGCKDICVYVPAALRFDSVPGLITITLSTTCGRSMISKIPATNGPRRPP